MFNVYGITLELLNATWDNQKLTKVIRFLLLLLELEAGSFHFPFFSPTESRKIIYSKRWQKWEIPPDNILCYNSDETYFPSEHVLLLTASLEFHCLVTIFKAFQRITCCEDIETIFRFTSSKESNVISQKNSTFYFKRGHKHFMETTQFRLHRDVIHPSVKKWQERGLGEMGRKLKRKGTYVYLWLICVDVWQKSTQYCNYPSIKNKYIKKKKKSATF